MFSYTDDAIVTSSPTGRHLSTVIRRPAAIGPLDWAEHADQVCKVLNELDRNAKLNYQVSYRLGRGFPVAGSIGAGTWPLQDQMPLGNAEPTPASARIAELEKPAVISLETAALQVFLNVVGAGSLLSTKAECGRTVIIKRVE